MRIHVHVHHHLDQAAERKLDQILNALVELKEIIMTDFSKLQSEVNDIATTDDAVLALIDGLVAELKNAPDQAAVDAIVAGLETKRTQLAAAVVANTVVPPAAGQSPTPAAGAPTPEDASKT